MKQTPPLVIFGFDAGDERFLRAWAESGDLPFLRSIMDRGAWGRTAGAELLSEHGMWPIITSGVSRADQGYYYHRQLVAGRYELAPARGRFLPHKPFWTRLGSRKKIAIIDVPDVAAPEPQPGIQLAEWGVHYSYFSPSTQPPELLREVETIFGPQDVIHEDLESTYEKDLQIYERLLNRTRKKGILCRRLLAHDAFDLIFIVFGECHTGGHQFWKYRPEATGSDAVHGTELTGAIKNIYKAIDEEMGRILEELPETNVAVLASVGFKSHYPTEFLTENVLRTLDYQVSPASAKPSMRPTSLLRKLLPQPVRDQISRLLSEERREQLLSDKWRAGIDWSRTTAFSIPSYYTGYIRINLRGREPQGTVAPGEYEAILTRLERDFGSLVDPVTGKPAVRAVHRTVDLFGGGPPSVLPDLFVDWAEGDHFLERVLHASGEIMQKRGHWYRGSDHSQHGFAALAGPSIQLRGDLGFISPLDLTPTFLHLIGIERQTDLPGRPLTEGVASGLMEIGN